MAKPTQVTKVGVRLDEGGDWVRQRNELGKMEDIWEPWEDSEDAAKAALSLYDELRQEDVTYTVAIEMAGPVYLSYGGFATRNQAAKWIEKGFPLSETTKSAIIPVYHYKHYERQLKEADEVPAPKGDWVKVERDREAGVFKHG